MYYYIITLLSFICFMVKSLNLKKQYLYYLGSTYLFFILIFLISGLRYGVGTDFFSYKEIFDLESNIEPIFFLLIKSTKFIGGGYPLFIFIVFSLSFSIKLFSFHKLSYHKGFFLSVMLFCSFYYIAYEMNAIRQGLSLSLTMLASYYAYKKNKIKYSVSVIIATLIHYTAFIFLPFYYMINYKISKKAALLWCIFAFILSTNNSFNTLINLSTFFLGEHEISARIMAYSSSEEFNNNLLISFSTIRRLLFFVLILYTYEFIDAKERIKQIIFWGAFISIILYLLFAQVGYFSTRLSVYYRVYECVWLSYLPFIFKKKSTKIFIIIFFFLYSLSQVASALSLENNGLIPIQLFIFQDLW